MIWPSLITETAGNSSCQLGTPRNKDATDRYTQFIEERNVLHTSLPSYWNSPVPATLPAYTNRIPWDQEAYFIIT